MKKTYQFVACSTCAIMLLSLSSCATKTQSGALGGGIAGAAIGGAVGGGEGALIGGAAGVIGGAIIGSAMDESDAKNKKQELYLSDLVRWKQQGMSESEIQTRLVRRNAQLSPLSQEQIKYLKDNGFSQNFINWYMGQTRA